MPAKQRVGTYALTLSALVCFVILSGIARAQVDEGPDAYAPGDAPSWATLKKSYDVDSKKPPAAKEELRASTAAYSIHVTITGPDGESIPAGFMRPKADGAYPTILLMHGLSSTKDVMLKLYGTELVLHGFAVLALDAPYHGERKNPEISQMDTTVFGETIHQGCREYRRALDWLTSRKDVDATRIGLLGYNMGAIMGAILAGVDERIQDVILCGGGDPIVSFASNIPEGKRDRMYTICPSLFVSHISPRPILMLNGKMDQVMQDTAALRLYEAARKPKTMEWFDSGHVLPFTHVIRCVNWFVDQFHPVLKSA